MEQLYGYQEHDMWYVRVRVPAFGYCPKHLHAQSRTHADSPIAEPVEPSSQPSIPPAVLQRNRTLQSGVIETL